MDAFESLVAMLLEREGYWTTTRFKVDLTSAEKCRIGRPSSPRWEIDVVAYKGSTNELLAVECKSFLDSPGVVFRHGAFEPSSRYKLFTDATLRNVVLRRLARQLVRSGACIARPRVNLCLAIGNVARRSDRTGLNAHFERNGWRLLDEAWLCERLGAAADSAYQDDVAHVVAKLLLRNRAA